MTVDADRPLVTFALFAYNQEQFIAEAVQGALQQTYSPLEIILSDDCSPDRTFEIMQEMAAAYKGPHTVVLNRNETNLGLTGHINRVMEMVQGELVVVAAGDDISMNHRTETIVRIYLDFHRQAFSIFSNAIWIDERGNQLNLLRKRKVSQDELLLENYASRQNPGFVHGATQAWQKSIFDFFGPLPTEVFSEDTIIPFRAALLGKIAYIHEPLVYYRRDISRIKNKKRIYSYMQYSQAWNRSRQNRLLTFQARLKDMERHLEQHPESAKNLKPIEDVTLKHIQELRQEKYRFIKCWISFVTTVLYFVYQNILRVYHTQNS